MRAALFLILTATLATACMKPSGDKTPAKALPTDAQKLQKNGEQKSILPEQLYIGISDATNPENKEPGQPLANSSMDVAHGASGVATEKGVSKCEVSVETDKITVPGEEDHKSLSVHVKLTVVQEDGTERTASGHVIADEFTLLNVGDASMKRICVVQPMAAQAPAVEEAPAK
ncbi:MAG TPA: hypothetical protein VM432_03035 [Bdellovibrionales bacterium]|nr:hypothetical protein [Bdellovibrionales bacterium]